VCECGRAVIRKRGACGHEDRVIFKYMLGPPGTPVQYFTLFANDDRFKCKSMTTNNRRRSWPDTNCRAVFKTGAQNTDKNHDGNQRPVVNANDFPEADGNNWWLTCDSGCSECTAGINQGLDFNKCCPDVAFDDPPTDAQIDACRAVDQTTVALQSCGFLTAKCRQLTIWHNTAHDQTQVLHGASKEASYYGFIQADPNYEWQPWDFVLWKHAKCNFDGIGDRSSTCSSTKSCTCSSAPNGLTCDNVPSTVQNILGVYCGQL